MVHNKSSSLVVRILVPLSALALIMMLPGAAAQVTNVGVTIPADPVEVMPAGAAGQINGNVTYQCGTTVNDITVTAALPEGMGGSVGVAPEAITPTMLPECTPDQTPASPFSVSFAPAIDQIAGTEVKVKVTASASLEPTGTADPETADGDAVFLVGPYLDVSFAPNVTSIEAAAGDEVPVSVMIESKSNTLVMAMPTISAPATWERPDALPMNIKSPLEEGADGTEVLDFVIKIPADAEGTVTLELTMFAHSLTNTYVQTEEVVFPFTVDVTPAAGAGGDDGDAEESPAVPLAPLVFLGAALVVLARRR